jgi:hypothetical protein
MPYSSIKISDNTQNPGNGKRAMAIFSGKDMKDKTIYFGMSGSKGTYYDIGNTEFGKKKRAAYLARHSKMGEDWTKSGMLTPGFLSRWVLWPDIHTKQGIIKKLKELTGINKITMNIEKYDVVE